MTALRLLPVALLALAATSFGAAPAHATGQSVIMRNYAFSPSTLTVHAGDVVTWTNYDQAPHDVTTTSAPVAIKSPTLSTGQSFSYTFSVAGTYLYYCSIHPDMLAQVDVQPTAPAAAPAPKPVRQTPPAAPHVTARQPAVPQPAARSMPMPVPVPAAVPAQAGGAVASTPSAAQPAQPAVAAGAATTTLDPMLIVAGITAGVTVVCLLLLGSRRET